MLGLFSTAIFNKRVELVVFSFGIILLCCFSCKLCTCKEWGSSVFTYRIRQNKIQGEEQHVLLVMPLFLLLGTERDRNK